MNQQKVAWVVLIVVAVIAAAYLLKTGATPDPANTAWGAIIAAALTGVVSVLLRGGVDEKIERLKSELTTARSEDDARREYEYEARKRLYSECEPLIFQLRELAENQMYRVYSLARSARLGRIQEDGTGWLSGGEGYYLESTVYNLLAPAVVFKIMQRRLTAVDMRLDPKIKALYLFAKQFYLAFSDDFTFARTRPSLSSYDPEREGWKELRIKSPGMVWKQGITWGRLDSAVESLVVSPEGQAERCMSFGEFQRAWRDKEKDLKARFEQAFDIFDRFHPRTRPVLWHMVIAQAVICAAIIEAADSAATSPKLPRLDPEKVKWSTKQEDEAEMAQPLEVAVEYLKAQLPTVWAAGK